MNRSTTEVDALKKQALELMDGVTGSGGSLPKLVVLDLDYTIWPLWCDCSSIMDTPRLFKEAGPVIEALHDKGVSLAVASRTTAPDIAASFLKRLSLDALFPVKEIYPSWTHKTDHFREIKTKTGIPYESMLFFDDEDRNTKTITQLGVTCILVENGLNLEAFAEGIRAFSQSKLHDS